MASLIPWRSRRMDLDPIQMFESIKDDMDRMFNLSLGRWTPRPSNGDALWAPTVDVIDQKNKFLVRAELPGLNKDDIQISVEGNAVVIRGEKKEDVEKKEEGYVRKESFHGSFYRSLPLPEGVDPSQIEASYKKGVLEIALPKSETAAAKKIPIKTKSEED